MESITVKDIPNTNEVMINSSTILEPVSNQNVGLKFFIKFFLFLSFQLLTFTLWKLYSINDSNTLPYTYDTFTRLTEWILATCPAVIPVLFFKNYFSRSTTIYFILLIPVVLIISTFTIPVYLNVLFYFISFLYMLAWIVYVLFKMIEEKYVDRRSLIIVNIVTILFFITCGLFIL